MQITSGFKTILSRPLIYSAFQYLMGSHQIWSFFVKKIIRPKYGDVILDIGCGPADILNYFPEVDYYGFDISKSYINKAKKRYGKRGNFFAKSLIFDDLKNMPKFDLVIASGVLHHMNDETARRIFKVAYSALKPGGRFLTIDPCFTPNQNAIARFLISNDRGKNVRNQKGYQSLCKNIFTDMKINVKHRLWIPYTHCIMECTK